MIQLYIQQKRYIFKILCQTIIQLGRYRIRICIVVINEFDHDL